MTAMRTRVCKPELKRCVNKITIELGRVRTYRYISQLGQAAIRFVKNFSTVDDVDMVMLPSFQCGYRSRVFASIPSGIRLKAIVDRGRLFHDNDDVKE